MAPITALLNSLVSCTPLNGNLHARLSSVSSTVILQRSLAFPVNDKKWETFSTSTSSNGNNIVSSLNSEQTDKDSKLPTRRKAILVPTVGACVLLAELFTPLNPQKATASPAKFTDMPALRGKDYGKSVTRYPDYVLTESGLQYKDLREGTGDSPAPGQTVVIDWAGFTIGYYGRIFEARNKAKGGSFEGDEKEYFRFTVGNGQVIDAIEEGIKTMKVGGVRRMIVPPELGYPNNDFNAKGPKPLTFSGQRALDFVLKNQGLIDKTLLFDVELLRISN